ncbi:MAG: EthD domain-containing protein [Dehalococcoidia bacterium]
MPEKVFFFVQRAANLDRDEFARRYLEEHAPLAMRHFRALRRYVVNIVERDPETDPLVPADGISEMWFDSLEDFTDAERLYDSPEGAAKVIEQSASVFGGVSAYHVDGTVQRDYERTWPLGERSPGTKLLGPLRRLDGLTKEQFVEHWRGTHARLALEHVLGIGRYVTNVVRAPLIPGSPEFDGIVEVSYLEKRRFATPESEAIMQADTASFLIKPRSYSVGEYVLRE